MKTLVVAFVMIIAAWGQNAGAVGGTLWTECAGCGSNNNDVFLLSWGGNWTRPYLILKNYVSAQPNSAFQGYLFGVGTGGCLSSPDYGLYYKMWSCQGSNCQPDSNVKLVPLQPCQCIPW